MYIANFLNLRKAYCLSVKKFVDSKFKYIKGLGTNTKEERLYQWKKENLTF